MQFKDLTTFKIGGPIKYFFEVKTDEEISKAGKFSKENNLKIYNSHDLQVVGNK
jgi:UDP-N-acetylenolpyruvoylglucosamine reductase